MTPSWPGDGLTRWSRRALALSSRLVQAPARQEWLREWEAELWQLRRQGRGSVRLSAFLAGAMWHGLWERLRGWRAGVEAVRQDVRYAVRTLRRSPGFACAAVAMLALSIGANTALFSVIEASVLAAPPYPDPGRLVVVDTLFGATEAEMRPSLWSYPRYLAFRDQARSLETVAGYGRRTMTVTELGLPEVVSVETVTPSLFPLLGIRAERGRVFGPLEEDRGAPILAALVSHRFWQSRMAGAPDVVGSRVTLDRLRFEVLGVLPEGFGGLTGDAQIWIPLAALRQLEGSDALDQAWNQYFNVAGRLASGASIDAARREAQAFGATITTRFPPPTAASRIVASADVVSYSDARVNPLARTSMVVLFAAVGLLLLIATANLAGLLLARGAGRQREAAIRVSLGAGRGRLVRQLLTESLTLSAVGGALGVGAAWFGVAALGAWLAGALGTEGGRSLQYLDPESLRLNWRVLVFAITLTALVGIVVGLFPAWQAARTDPNASLKSDQRTAAGGSGVTGRSGLIVLQVAVTLMLLASASLLMRSLANLQRVDAGYDARNLLTAVYTLTPSDRASGIDPATFHFDFLEQVRALPGVDAATLGEVPMAGPTINTIVMGSDGRPELQPLDHVHIRVMPVADGHVSVIGARLIEGRDIRASDTAAVDPVVILNQTAAAELFPQGDALGRRMKLGWPQYLKNGAEIVGIVEDQRMSGAVGVAEAQAFVALRQLPQLSMGVLVRTRIDPDALQAALRNTLARLNPNVALTSMMSMEDRLAGVTTRPRMVARLLSVFAGVSLFLVAAGLYGTIAFAVAQRTRELGVRASLGADRLSLAVLVLRRALGVTAMGLVMGAAGAVWATRYFQSLLFETDGLEPLALAGVAAVLLLVAVLAAYVPARRAMRIDPITALRSD